jgi:hypothetical protein
MKKPVKGAGYGTSKSAVIDHQVPFSVENVA